jgi:hypothetical protein
MIYWLGLRYIALTVLGKFDLKIGFILRRNVSVNSTCTRTV